MYNRVYTSIVSKLKAFIRVKQLRKISSKCTNELYESLVPHVEQGVSYPKTVYQTYFSKKLPDELLEANNDLKKKNPDWKFFLFDDDDIEEYIKLNFPSILTFYNTIDFNYGAARADVFRYLVLYKEGGIYLDIKSSFSKPLDELVKDKTGFILSHWDNQIRGKEHFRYGIHPEIPLKKGEYLQCVIICPKGHLYLRTVIKNLICQIASYDKGIHGTGRFGVLRVTGPIMFTNAILSIKDKSLETFCDLFEEGYIYNILENESHHILFKKHYSELTIPIVSQKDRI